MYRKANIEDCSEVYALICELEGKELPYKEFAKIFSEQVKDEHYYCLVYEYEDKVIAVLNLRFEGQLHHASKIAEIMEFEVSEKYRSGGIGKQMVTAAFEIARDLGCSQIEVATNNLRKGAHRFYSRAGMHNFHYKFSMPLIGEDFEENAIGR